MNSLPEGASIASLSKKPYETPETYLRKIESNVMYAWDLGVKTGTFEQDVAMLFVENLPKTEDYMEIHLMFSKLRLEDGKPNEEVYGYGNKWKPTRARLLGVLDLCESNRELRREQRNEMRKKARIGEYHASCSSANMEFDREPTPDTPEPEIPDFNNDDFRIQAVQIGGGVHNPIIRDEIVPRVEGEAPPPMILVLPIDDEDIEEEEEEEEDPEEDPEEEFEEVEDDQE